MLVAHRTSIDTGASGLAGLLPGLVEVRELRDVVLERPVAPGETVHLSVRIENAVPLADESELLRTAWKVVNDAGETVVRAHADVVCRGPCEDRVATAGSEAPDDVDIEQIPV